MASDRSDRGHPLAPADTSWWHMEQPDNQMVITAVMAFDGPIDFEHLHYLIASKLLAYPRFRERVVPPAVPFSPPLWVRDPSFDLHHHFQRASLPPPAGRRELQELVGRLMSQPLDRDRPLWQYVYVDNYRDGCAIVGRFHHCIADGIALVDLLMHLDDQPGHETPPIVGALRMPGAPSLHGGLFGLPLQAALAGVRLGASIAGVAGKLLSLGSDANTPLRGALSTDKRAAWSDAVPLPALREAARRFDGTVNDVVAAGIAGSLHHFLRDRMELHPELTLRAIVPVNLRPPSEYGTLGNRFGLVWLPLPVGIADPVDRLRAVKRAMDGIKRSPEAHVVFGLLDLFGRTTRTAVHLAVQFLARGATLVFTNVPGPREDVHFCGRRLTELMGWVPQSGRLGLGMSVVSYAEEMRLGVTTDAALVREPGELVEAYHRALEGILDDAGAHVTLSAVG